MHTIARSLAALALTAGAAAIASTPAAAVETALSVAPLSVDFGAVDVGVTVQAAVQVTNTSPSASFTVHMFGGAPPSAEFNASQNCQLATLPPGGSCQITYTFTPAEPGRATDASNFTLSPTTSQDDGEDFSVSLEGCGIPCAHEQAVTFDLRGHLVGIGTVATVDGFPGCTSRAIVLLQRKVDGTWRTIDTAVPSDDGTFSDELLDRQAKHRAIVKRQVLNGGDHVCKVDVSPAVLHRHL